MGLQCGEPPTGLEREVWEVTTCPHGDHALGVPRAYSVLGLQGLLPRKLPALHRSG